MDKIPPPTGSNINNFNNVQQPPISYGQHTNQQQVGQTPNQYVPQSINQFNQPIKPGLIPQNQMPPPLRPSNTPIGPPNQNNSPVPFNLPPSSMGGQRPHQSYTSAINNFPQQTSMQANPIKQNMSPSINRSNTNAATSFPNASYIQSQPTQNVNSNMPPLAQSSQPVVNGPQMFPGQTYKQPSLAPTSTAPPFSSPNHVPPSASQLRPPMAQPTSMQNFSSPQMPRTPPTQARTSPHIGPPPQSINGNTISGVSPLPNYPPQNGTSVDQRTLTNVYPGKNMNQVQSTQMPGINQPSPAINSRYPTNVPPQQHQQYGGNDVVSKQPYPQAASQVAQSQFYNGPQSITQQMGQLNVTQQGFNQLWGQQVFDLLQMKQVLPEYPEELPEIKLGHLFNEAINCSPEIFRCTINKIPESNNLLQKSRLPLGVLIHPFKDLNHLPVIQCSSIVRCRVCRTYINPFVYFVDSKRWKCNLCFRVNELPEEFQYDPVSKSYGDPTRRPEVKSATIEFIAPGEYMLRPPQPCVYLFLLDVSHIARDCGYLKVFCETLKENLEQLPGDARTQIGFICYDSAVHFYNLGEGLTRAREMTVIDIDDVFLPSPESLLVNISERREMIMDLLDTLPNRHSSHGVPGSALGAALQAAYKLISPTGGRVTVMQTSLPNVGPGALTSREDPNARSSTEVAHLNPATDFYKRLALDCSGSQVAVDLFLLNSQYADLSTLSGISKFSGGTVYHIPLYNTSRTWQAEQYKRMLCRYLTRKIGLEAVMRVRCTRGIAIHTFHGNFFVRSTDLLSLPNVSPDAGFGMQLTIEESLSDLQQVCFQAALLYTSSKGERRIRVHTLCLPVANSLMDVLHSADQQCIIGLLVKMAVDRCHTSSLSDAREAISNVSVDLLSAHRMAQNLPSGSHLGLNAPACLRLIPLYLLAVLKHPAFRTGKSTRLDDRVAAMCNMKSLPLYQLMRSIYPDLYPIHCLQSYISNTESSDDEEISPDPPRLHLTAERINSNGAYLLDDGELMTIYIGQSVSPVYLNDTFGFSNMNQMPEELRELPRLDTSSNRLLHAFVNRLNDDRPYASNVLIVRDNAPSKLQFTERLVDDRLETMFSYYEFLQHIKTQMK